MRRRVSEGKDPGRLPPSTAGYEQEDGIRGGRKETIESLTDRKVLAFLSQAHIEPDITIEIFFIDRPMEGFGAVEVLDAGRLP